MTAKEAHLLWKPGTDKVAVYPFPAPSHLFRETYTMDALASYVDIRKMNFEQLKAVCFVEAMHLIVRDKCDPVAVHNAMLVVDEYRDGCSYGMPGMNEREA